MSGSDEDLYMEGKTEQYKFRYDRTIQAITQAVASLEDVEDNGNIDLNLTQPPLAMCQIFLTLKKCGCDIINCSNEVNIFWMLVLHVCFYIIACFWLLISKFLLCLEAGLVRRMSEMLRRPWTLPKFQKMVPYGWEGLYTVPDTPDKVQETSRPMLMQNFFWKESKYALRCAHPLEKDSTTRVVIDQTVS